MVNFQQYINISFTKNINILLKMGAKFMENLFWDIFKKSGDIDAFLAYKEYKNNTKNDKENNKNNY